MNKYNNAAAAVREVLATMDAGTVFSGYDLKNKATNLYPDGSNMYVDTFLREMRKCCSSDYQLISRSESLYQKITESRQQKRAAELNHYKDLKQQELFTEGV